jgi:hypothetical protein
MPSAETVLTVAVPNEGVVTLSVPGLRQGDIQPETGAITVGGYAQAEFSLGVDYDHEQVFAINRGMNPWPAGAKVVVAWGGDSLEGQVDTLERRLGVVDGTDALPGEVGEFFSATIPQSEAVPALNNTNVNVAELLLPPGDWNVRGQIWVTNLGSAADAEEMGKMQVVGVAAWTHEVSVTQPPSPQGNLFSIIGINYQTVGGSLLVINTGLMRVLSSTPRTVYLSGNVQYTGSGSLGLYGFIGARRMR